MRSLLWSLSGAMMFVGLSGCGSSESTPAANSASPAQSAATGDAAVAADPRTADQVVQDFLTAIRSGDDKTAEQLLTPLAKQRTAEHELVVAPPGSDTASFKITGSEKVGDDAAHVASEWTDIGEDGRPQTDAIVWILRHEPQGWRIAGMGSKLFEDQPPLFLNFEDPEDMIRKQQLAEQEIRRREQLASGEPSADTAAAETSEANSSGDGDIAEAAPPANAEDATDGVDGNLSRPARQTARPSGRPQRQAARPRENAPPR